MKPRLCDVDFEVTCVPSSVPARGNVLAVSPAEDRKAEAKVIERVNAGDPWAWGVVTVTARWNGLQGVCVFQVETTRSRFLRSADYREMRREAVQAMLEYAPTQQG